MSLMITYYWIRDSFISTKKPLSKTPILQLISLMPQKPHEELAFGELSDTKHFVRCIFTQNSIDNFASNEPERKFTKLNGSLLLLTDFEFVNKEEPSKIALRVDSFKFISCEGEAMYGQPENIRTFLPNFREKQKKANQVAAEGHDLALLELVETSEKMKTPAKRKDSESDSEEFSLDYDDINVPQSQLKKLFGQADQEDLQKMSSPEINTPANISLPPDVFNDIYGDHGGSIDFDSQEMASDPVLESDNGLITQCVLNSEGMNSFEKKLDAESHRIYQERNKDHDQTEYRPSINQSLPKLPESLIAPLQPELLLPMIEIQKSITQESQTQSTIGEINELCLSESQSIELEEPMTQNKTLADGEVKDSRNIVNLVQTENQDKHEETSCLSPPVQAKEVQDSETPPLPHNNDFIPSLLSSPSVPSHMLHYDSYLDVSSQPQTPFSPISSNPNESLPEKPVEIPSNSQALNAILKRVEEESLEQDLEFKRLLRESEEREKRFDAELAEMAAGSDQEQQTVVPPQLTQEETQQPHSQANSPSYSLQLDEIGSKEENQDENTPSLCEIEDVAESQQNPPKETQNNNDDCFQTQASFDYALLSKLLENLDDLKEDSPNCKENEVIVIASDTSQESPLETNLKATRKECADEIEVSSEEWVEDNEASSNPIESRYERHLKKLETDLANFEVLDKNSIETREKQKVNEERAEKERAEKERAEKQENIKRAEKELADKERAEKERAEKERAEKERAEKERAEKERAEKERAERQAQKERTEKERAEKERAEKERAEKERAEKERAEKQAQKKGAKQERAEKERAEKKRAVEMELRLLIQKDEIDMPKIQKIEKKKSVEQERADQQLSKRENNKKKELTPKKQETSKPTKESENDNEKRRKKRKHEDQNAEKQERNQAEIEVQNTPIKVEKLLKENPTNIESSKITIKEKPPKKLFSQCYVVIEPVPTHKLKPAKKSKAHENSLDSKREEKETSAEEKERDEEIKITASKKRKLAQEIEPETKHNEEQNEKPYISPSTQQKDKDFIEEEMPFTQLPFERSFFVEEKETQNAPEGNEETVSLHFNNSQPEQIPEATNSNVSVPYKNNETERNICSFDDTLPQRLEIDLELDERNNEEVSPTWSLKTPEKSSKGNQKIQPKIEIESEIEIVNPLPKEITEKRKRESNHKDEENEDEENEDEEDEDIKELEPPSKKRKSGTFKYVPLFLKETTIGVSSISKWFQNKNVKKETS